MTYFLYPLFYSPSRWLSSTYHYILFREIFFSFLLLCFLLQYSSSFLWRFCITTPTVRSSAGAPDGIEVRFMRVCARRHYRLQAPSNFDHCIISLQDGRHFSAADKGFSKNAAFVKKSFVSRARAQLSSAASLSDRHMWELKKYCVKLWIQN